MANSRLTDLTAQTTAHDADVLYIVDTTDTTQSAAGTSKKITRANLFTNVTLTKPTIALIKGGNSNTNGHTVPNLADDTVTLNAASQTLTNKTLTTPVISTISNTGTLTLPTSSDTLVGKATTDVFTNKSIDGSTNTLTNIPATALSTSAITLGYAQITSNFTTTTQSSDVDIGISVTVTVPTGGRYVKITGYCRDMSCTTAGGNILDFKIKESTTVLQISSGVSQAANTAIPALVQYVSSSVTSGSHTYKLSAQQSGAGTFKFEAGATYPAFILVEVI